MEPPFNGGSVKNFYQFFPKKAGAGTMECLSSCEPHQNMVVDTWVDMVSIK